MNRGIIMPIYKTNKKKDGKIQYRVVVNYTDSNGIHKKAERWVYGRDEARAAELSLIKKTSESEITRRLTVQQLYDEYIVAKESEVRTSSLNKTKSILKNHVLNTKLKSRRIDKLTVPVLQEWKNDLSKKDIMISTKNNAIRELTTLLNYAVKMEYIPKNPMKNVGKFKNPYFTVKQEQIHYYTKEQFDRYIEAARADRHNLTDYACCVFFFLLFYSGLRKGELNALKWSDLEGNIIHVRRSINQKVKGYEETPPKNEASYRDVKLPQIAMKVIDDHRAVLAQHEQYSDDWRLCGGFNPITDTNIENHNKRYAELAGLPHIRIHDFRHSHATMLINKGVNIIAVSRRLGHSNVKTTLNTYAHLYPSTEDEALDLMDNM
jgi:integrase